MLVAPVRMMTIANQYRPHGPVVPALDQEGDRRERDEQPKATEKPNPLSCAYRSPSFVPKMLAKVIASQ